MKILYDHQFFSVFPYSGISRYIYEVIRRLCRQPGADISLYMGWHVNKYGFKDYRKYLRHFFSFKRPTFRGAPRIFNRINDTLFPLAAFLAKPDVYHQIYYDYLIPSFKGVRVATVYDMTSEVTGITGGKGDMTMENKKKTALHADALIAISQSTKKDIMGIYNIPPEKVHVIYLANSLEYTITEPSPLDSTYILYVGQRCPHKNFDTLLDVYLQQNDINREFKLVCFGGAPLTERESAELAQKGLAGRCIHIQGGNDYLLALYYKHASLLVYPSLYEGFGMPVLEAMHYGCPVVVSNSSSLPEIAGDGGMLFHPQDRHDLYSKMKSILFDKVIRDRVITAAYLQEKKFSWDRCAEETFAFYKNVL